ncbi:ABC transporter permease subunit [Streptomyces tsukubensis]|uniref:ABC transporter permease n=1 Tax=Streptomyces tsukubensis TaxID=83656 RepID=A0A1V4A9A1_9ACTN|nr:ABC transporter permease subunit [Streptomyces tsukubensis]OON78800.1 ABC transporter permease [Streptomyces tsukubensis]QFR94276.1 ABC transporter permease subunit [Streptomyces tsukubensis]
MRYVAGRLCALVAVVAVIGLLPWLTRTDPALTILHARYADRPPTPAVLDAIRAQTGLDGGPAHVLGEWAAGIFRGDLGRSWVSDAPVAPDVVSAAGTSLALMGCSLVVAVLLAAALSAGTLRRGARRRITGAKAGVTAAVLAALPEFLLAAVLATVLAVQLGWFPAVGWGGAGQAVLPAVAMGVPAGALLGRLLDDALPAAFAEPWARAATAGGVPPARIAAHALRRALPGLLPQLGLVVVGLTGGAVAVETLFSIPGLGGTALSAALAQDLPVLQACVLVLLLLGVAAALAARLASRVLLGPAARDGALPALVAPPLPASRALGRCAAVLALLFVAVAVAGLLRDPLHVDAAARLAAPSGAHPFGTDSLGRDILARLGHGAARTVLTAVAVSAATLLIGLVVGLLRGAALTETVNALPAILSGLVVAGIAGPGAWGAALAVTAVSWSPLAAHTTALYEQERAAPHVAAARSLGAGRLHLLRGHLLPGVVPPVVRHAVLRVPAVALALASLGFLGLGTPAPAPEWGRMLSENMPYAERAPWSVLAPAAALMVLGALAVLTAAAVRGRGRAARLVHLAEADPR